MSFKKAIFSVNTNFGKHEWYDTVVFNETADFSDTIFIGNVNFDEVIFKKGANFTGSTLNGEPFDPTQLLIL